MTKIERQKKSRDWMGVGGVELAIICLAALVVLPVKKIKLIGFVEGPAMLLLLIRNYARL